MMTIGIEIDNMSIQNKINDLYGKIKELRKSGKTDEAEKSAAKLAGMVEIAREFFIVVKPVEKAKSGGWFDLIQKSAIYDTPIKICGNCIKC